MITSILVTSTAGLVVGLLLIWRGQQMVAHLSELPTRHRISLLTRGYVSVLQGYRYLNDVSLAFITILLGIAPLAYVFLTYLSITVDFSEITVAADLQEAMRPVDQKMRALFEPWFLAFMSAVSLFLLLHSLWRGILPALVTPKLNRRVNHIRTCVTACATNGELIGYVDAENAVSDYKSLVHLLLLAKGMLGAHESQLLNEMLAELAVSDEVQGEASTAQA